MPSAVAPPLVTKPDNIELAVHHGNQINKSLWHDSSPLQALQRAKPQHGHSCLPTSGTPFGHTGMLSGGSMCPLGGLFRGSGLLSHLSELYLGMSTPHERGRDVPFLSLSC